MEISVVPIEKKEEMQLVIGHAGFIKSAEDIYEAMADSAPGIKFGVAFVEASGPCLVRSEGNDEELRKLAEKNALAIGAGHTFVALFTGAFPINVIGSIRQVHEVANIYCATANPTKVVVGDDKEGRAVLGIIDGSRAKGIEGSKEKAARRKFVREIGYKLG
jgi:adenosine/AMP kinase